MSKFVYPRLAREDIISILAESQIALITEADLQRPKSEFVIDMYTKLLVHLDTLQEDHGQVEFAALEQLENPDRHVDSVRILNLCNKVRETLEAIQCPLKFTLKDLLKPDGERTEFFVGSMVNYGLHRQAMFALLLENAVFLTEYSSIAETVFMITGIGLVAFQGQEAFQKDGKMDQLKPVYEQLSALDEYRKEIEDKIAEIVSEIDKYDEFKEKESPFVQELQSQIQGLNQNIATLNNHQLSLKTALIKLQEKTAALDGKISSAEFSLIQSVQENANLRAKIVQSPDKLQKSLEDKKLMLADAKNAERSAMQLFHEKKAILEVYTKACKKMSKHLDQMQAIHEQLSSAKSTEKDVKALRTKLDDERVLDKSLDAKIVEKQGNVDKLDASRKQLLREKELKCEEASKEIAELKMDIESRKRDLLTRQKKVEALVAEVDAITSKTSTVKASGASKQHELMLKAEEILKTFNQYSSSINSVLPK